MRAIDLLYTTLVVACLNPASSYAQSGEQHRSAEEQTEPYHKHHDTRHGHDHFYPDRGAIVRDLPRGTIGTSYAGVSYRYHDGIWLEPRGPAFMVIAPPIGLVAPTLPLFSTVVTHDGETFLYVNDTYYRPRPDLGGYEVVNDPAEDSSPQAAPDALVGGQLPGAAAAQASTSTAAVLTPGLAVPVAGVTTASTAAPRVVATQAASFPPPPSASVTAPSASMGIAAAVPVTTSTSTPTASASTQAAIAPAVAAVPAASPAGPGSPETQKGPKVFLYPRNGQTSDQQARDRYDCYRFAVAQSGFDPMRASGAASQAPAGEMQSDYERAQGACFEARGYASR
jgi:hypothetical protein